MWQTQDIKVEIGPKNTLDERGNCKWDVGAGWYEGRLQDVEFPQFIVEGQEVQISLPNARVQDYTLKGLAKSVKPNNFIFLREATTKEEWDQILEAIGTAHESDSSELIFYAGG